MQSDNDLISASIKKTQYSYFKRISCVFWKVKGRKVFHSALFFMEERNQTLKGRRTMGRSVHQAGPFFKGGRKGKQVKTVSDAAGGVGKDGETMPQGQAEKLFRKGGDGLAHSKGSMVHRLKFPSARIHIGWIVRLREERKGGKNVGDILQGLGMGL